MSATYFYHQNNGENIVALMHLLLKNTFLDKDFLMVQVVKNRITLFYNRTANFLLSFLFLTAFLVLLCNYPKINGTALD